MSKICSFEDLQVWQLSREFNKKIYQATGKTPWKADCRFVSQITAASGSIMDNIAEGFGREGTKEYVNFLYIAKGSCEEVKSQLYRAYDVGYLSVEQFDVLFKDIRTISVMLHNFIKYLKECEHKGVKYKE
ncbi:MAG: four helix bundle protein [Paludibacteraceae bacterium]|nr:four helix bundle protein [Paludibacteraceae bacterium]